MNKKHLTRNKRTTQDIFDDGLSLIERNYQNLSMREQDKLRRNLEIGSHDVALGLINVAERFTGNVKDEIIQKHLYLDTLKNMATKTFTDKQVTQVLNLVPFPASNSKKCALDSIECKAIFYQVRDGVSIKNIQPTQEAFENLIEEEISDTSAFSQDLAYELLSHIKTLKEYRGYMEMAIVRMEGITKKIENIMSQIQTDAQKKTKLNGHSHQPKQ